MTKVSDKKYENMEIDELVKCADGCKILMTHYSNIIKRYDNSINPEYDKETKKLMNVEKLYYKIIGIIETKLFEIE